MVNLNRYDFVPSNCILKYYILKNFDSKLLVVKRYSFEIYHKGKCVKNITKIFLGAEVEAFAGFAKSFLQ